MKIIYYRKIRNYLEDVTDILELNSSMEDRDELDLKITNDAYQLLHLVNEKIQRKLEIPSTWVRLVIRYGNSVLDKYFTFEDRNMLTKVWSDEHFKAMVDYIEEQLKNDNLSPE